MDLTHNALVFDVSEPPVHPGAAQSRAGLRHREISTFHVQGGSVVGVAVIERSSSASFWEVHDGGDELLFIISGKLVFELQQPDGSRSSVPVETGQCILIPRGCPHAAKVVQDATVMFATPLVGSRSWQAQPDSVADLHKPI